MFRKAIIAGALALGFAAPAVAADLPYTKAPPMPRMLAYDWTGWYAGAHLGYYSGEGSLGIFAPGISLRADGIYGGLQGGYNWQFANNWVGGLWVSVPIAGSTSGVLPGLVSFRPGWGVAGGVRLGYAWDRFLPYVFAGAVASSQKVTVNAGPPVSQTNTHFGFTVGFGGEYALTDRWSVFGRYAYVNLGSENYFAGLVPGGIPVKSDAHTFAVGANYHFGR